jgi:hypothetical protein
MNMNKECNKIWIVVLVERGLPVSAEPYKMKRHAVQRYRTLRDQINILEDEVDIFESDILTRQPFETNSNL